MRLLIVVMWLIIPDVVGTFSWHIGLVMFDVSPFKGPEGVPASL